MAGERGRILITVKTYPNPSAKYRETVCTAGIDLATKRMVRLYPIRFRDLEFENSFEKWNVVELALTHRTRDGRGDTYTPDHDSIRVVDRVDTGKRRDWLERNRVVLPLVSTLEDLVTRAEKGEGSLGIVRVSADGELIVRPVSPEWTKRQEWILRRQSLFGGDRRPLEKVPYSFHYRFRCCSTCRGHELQVLDWEIYQLYRGQAAKKSPVEAVEDVLAKYNVDLNPRNNAIHLFVGTHYLRQAQFSAIGVYYPPSAAMPLV
jgi:hypothetical protein